MQGVLTTGDWREILTEIVEADLRRMPFAHSEPDSLNYTVHHTTIPMAIALSELSLLSAICSTIANKTHGHGLSCSEHTHNKKVIFNPIHIEYKAKCCSLMLVLHLESSG